MIRLQPFHSFIDFRYCAFHRCPCKLIKGKDGNEYLNISIICNDSENEWGKDVTITEGQSEQERKDKVKKNFIGSGKTVYNTDKQF